MYGCENSYGVKRDNGLTTVDRTDYNSKSVLVYSSTYNTRCMKISHGYMQDRVYVFFGSLTQVFSTPTIVFS